MDEATRKRRKFREILDRKTLTVMPGGFSPLYARAAEMIGFECFFIAGSQMSAYLLGVPDTGIIGLRDIVDHARHVASRTDIPIFLDADTGFGNAVNVHYTVAECVRAGVAGLQIEDQEAPKKSGISAGRRCIPVDEAVGKYRAAVAARDELDPEFVICARCDLLGAEGSSFDDAVERCKTYVRDGGVDLIWLNTIETVEQIEIACAEIPAPVLTIWAGKPPAPTLEEFERRGLRIALYPTVAASVGLQASWQVLNDLRQRGSVALDDWREDVKKSRYDAIDLSTLTGTDEVRRLEQTFLPQSAQRNYDGTWGHQTVLGFGDAAPGLKDK
jgi:2,3-dimethylmalate lyase